MSAEKPSPPAPPDSVTTAPPPVIPAQAGIHTDPAERKNPGVKAKPVNPMDSRLRGNDGRGGNDGSEQPTPATPEELTANLRFNSAGLIPVIAQCADSGAVLMMAWMNKETLQETLQTGQMTYFSRSRNRRWRKGEQSGNTQQCLALAADCDLDALLATVKQTGPACHTGAPSCFFNAFPLRHSRKSGNP